MIMIYFLIQGIKMHEHHRDRLRDKIFVDPNSLNDYEALELILFNAIPRKNTNDISHRLLDRFGTISAVLSASPEELMSIDGIGKSAASYLVTLGLVLKRKNDETKFPKVFDFNKIRQPLVEAFMGFSEEVFMAFLLDKRQMILCRKIIYSKNKHRVDIDLTDFSRQVAITKPEYVVIAHNHTSGHCQPSEDDDKATEKICLALALNGATLLDHIIVAGEKVYSYYYDRRLDIIRNKVELKLK